MATVSQIMRLTFLSTIPCALGSFIKEYALDGYCGRTITMKPIGSALKLKLTDRSHYSRNMNCLVHIKYDDWISSNNLTAQFLDIHIDCNDHVQLSDSSSGVGSQFCGENKPSPYTTSGADLYVRFTSDGSIQDRGFTLLINTFHTGICKSSEFLCDNGRCLNVDLKHDGYDNCGDNTDEYARKPDQNHHLWWMVFGMGVFIILSSFMMFGYCWIRRTRSRYVI